MTLPEKWNICSIYNSSGGRILQLKEHMCQIWELWRQKKDHMWFITGIHTIPPPPFNVALNQAFLTPAGNIVTSEKLQSSIMKCDTSENDYPKSFNVLI